MILKLLSSLVGLLASIRLPTLLLKPMLRIYCKTYSIELTDARRGCLSDYSSFDDFFTRRLKPEARVLGEQDIVCPSDGRISDEGTFRDCNRKIDCKGLELKLSELFGDRPVSQEFSGGAFSVMYLSPSDYHRVHSPVSGNIVSTIHIAGRLRTVDPKSTDDLPKVFIENERTITIIQSEHLGLTALIMVGATNVGSIELSYIRDRARSRSEFYKTSGIISDVEHATPIAIEKGEQLGVFHLGSTVILCAQANLASLDVKGIGERVHCLESIGRGLS